jgi:hypothetical protein
MQIVVDDIPWQGTLKAIYSSETTTETYLSCMQTSLSI